MTPVQRVTTTPAAQALIELLRERHGAIYFYQSHGCCDGSTPMLFAPGEMPIAADDVLFATVHGVPFWAGRAQADYLQGTQLTLDVGQGSLGTMSLENEEGVYFRTRTRLWTDEESAWLAAHPLT
jgi:uncharacterized protein (DUF779 family)